MLELHVCVICSNSTWDSLDNGWAFCVGCGIMDADPHYNGNSYRSTQEVLVHRQMYTRCKRFKKYLHRAARHQSQNTVPDDTWKYLLDRRPYSGPKHILKTLKKAKLKRKCYDSLPIISWALGMPVPVMNQADISAAMVHFRKLDAAFPPRTAFVSYVYALEYILIMIGRADMVPYLSKIQCTSRREKYKRKLDSIFTEPLANRTVIDLLKYSSV